MFDRNFPIINKETQSKIQKAKILFIGCGLGSNVAELLTRTGFENFYFIDGDNIEDTNLNRQEFFQNEIGKNKANVLKERIQKINPNVKVHTRERYVFSVDDVTDIFDWPDYIINTSDFSKGFFEYNILASTKRKLVLCPFNVGFGPVVLVFSHSNLAIQREMNIPDLSDAAYFSMLLSKAENYSVPEYFLPIFEKINSRTISYTPQLGIASRVASSIITTLISKHLGGGDINTFPKVHSVDLLNV